MEMIDNPDDWLSMGADTGGIHATIVVSPRKEVQITIAFLRGDSRFQFLERNEAQLQLLDIYLDNLSEHHIVVGYGSLRRLNKRQGYRSDASQGTETEYPLPNFRFQHVDTLFREDALLHSLTDWVFQATSQLQSGSAELITSTLNDFLLNVKFHSVDHRNGWLLFRSGHELIPLHLLSDGVQNMAAWIGDLLSRIIPLSDNIRPPSKAYGLLLIDEVELHLHPKWQRRILDFMRQKMPHFQIITTTHAPLVAQQCQEGELFQLHRNSRNNITLSAFPGAPSKMLVHQLLLSSAFGLETDESYEVEKLKKNYNSLKNRKGNNSARLEGLEKKIGEISPNVRSNANLSTEQFDLLKDIKAELNKRKGGND